ncbi:DDE_3 domain-containing protein [Trichonephila clavipes]|nr:DDE_3 domain-containing protein [Trichonephila clavipes]
MVWGGIYARGKTPLDFVEEGVKINQKVYQRDILEAAVLPFAQRHFKNANWTLQQNSALAHMAKKTQKFCKTNFPDMISSEELSPYSLDLKPMCMVYFGVQVLH